MKKIKIGYFADGVWSHRAFEKLLKNEKVEMVFICVRYDTKDETLKKYCSQYKIDYLKHKNINSAEFIDLISKYQADLFVSMSFNQIFKETIINMPKFKTINCHAGMLPFYRGRNILNWALINDEKEFGITVHYIDSGIDTGDIILQKAFPITDNDDYSTLLTLAHEECANILCQSIDLIIDNKVVSKKQTEIHPVGFYCTQRKEGDEIINWNQTSRELFNFVRAICIPGPMARATLNGLEMKINRIQIIKNAPIYKNVVGAIIKKEEDNSFWVKTKDSFVKIYEYDYAGKIKVGDRFEI